MSAEINEDRVSHAVSENKSFHPGLISLLALIGSLTVLVIVMAVATEPYTQADSHYYRMVLAAWSIVLLIIYLVFYKRNNKQYLFSLSPQKIPHLLSPNWILFFIFSATVIAGVFNYYQCDKIFFTTNKDNNDATYYYLNSKYFKELDYFNLYPAILIADEEKEQRLKHIPHYRDLKTYHMVGRQTITEQLRKEIKAPFTSERWGNFKHDVNHLIIHSRSDWDIWPYFFIDHGYNPPPTWTLVGGFFSELIPVEYLKLLTLLDLLLIIIMFVVIARSFGMDAMFFACLFFLCTYSGRWPQVGESILRFDWLVAVVLSVCMFKKERYFLAGVCLAYGALNRIFPAIFFFPYLILIIKDIYFEKSLNGKHLKFIGGAAALTIVIVGLALANYGVGAFETSAENLLLHQNKSYSKHRVGLADAAVYRGEKSDNDLNRNGGIPGKESQIIAMKPYLYFAAALCLIVIVLWIWRKQKQPHELIYLAMLPLFCVTIPQVNYYNMRLLLFLYHMYDPLKTRNIVGLSLLFTIEIITQYAMVAQLSRYLMSSITSVGLTLYFFIMLVVMILELLKDTNIIPTIKRFFICDWRHAVVYSVAYNLIFVSVLLSSWNHMDEKNKLLMAQQKSRLKRPPPPLPNKDTVKNTVAQTTTYDRLRYKKKTGANWHQNTIQITEGTHLKIVWGNSLSHAKQVDMSFDNNDSYQLIYRKDEKEIAQQIVRKPDSGTENGLQQLLVDVPEEAVDKGYDHVLIKAFGGDRMYSIGHFIFVKPDFRSIENIKRG